MALFRCYKLLKRRAYTHHKTHFQGPPLQSALKLKPMRLLKMFLTYDKWAIGPSLMVLNKGKAYLMPLSLPHTGLTNMTRLSSQSVALYSYHI